MDSVCGLLLPVMMLAFAMAARAAASSTLPPEAAQLLVVFDAECAKIKVQHEEAVVSLPRVYTNQIATLRRKFQESGDLEGMLAAIREEKRFIAAVEGEADPFERVPEMPESALVKSPEALCQLQESYLKNRSDRADVRNKQLVELVGRLTGRLDVIMRDLTIRNRIPEAVLVRREAEYWRQALADDRVFDMTERRAIVRTETASLPEQGAISDALITGPSNAPWRQWKLDQISNYAQEGSLFGHPDLPDELTIDVDKARGQIRVDGVCKISQAPVEMRERSWFGKAVRWTVPDSKLLAATFQIASRELAPAKDTGPAVQLIVQCDKARPQVFTRSIMYRDMTIQILYDAETASHRIVWVQGQIGIPVNVPANARTIRVLLTVTVNRPGERCDSLITLK